MASCVVVGSIFLAGDELLRVEELLVRSKPDLVNNGGLQIDKDGPKEWQNKRQHYRLVHALYTFSINLLK